MMPECKPEWNRQAMTVFSRLPGLRRLQATPPLQTSLPANYTRGSFDVNGQLLNLPKIWRGELAPCPSGSTGPNHDSVSPETLHLPFYQFSQNQEDSQ